MGRFPCLLNSKNQSHGLGSKNKTWSSNVKSHYPLVNIQKAIENGPVEIVDFPMKNGGSFHGKMLVHQRVETFP